LFNALLCILILLLFNALLCILILLLFNALLCILILSFCHFVKTLFKKHGKNVAEGCLSFGLTF